MLDSTKGNLSFSAKVLRQVMEQVANPTAVCTLHVSDAPNEKVIYFVNGGVRLLSVGERKGEEIESYLLRTGVLGFNTLHEVLEHCRGICRPGVTTAEINAEAERLIQKVEGAVPLFKNYPASGGAAAPFPAVTCISVNEEVVHGIPSSRTIREGDVVSIDFGVRIEGWCGDAATTVMVEPVTARCRRLCEVTEHVLQIAIENIRPGRTWSSIAKKMERYAETAGLSVVKEFVGHGIGRELHEEPKLPNYVSRELLHDDIELQPGMVLITGSIVRGIPVSRGDHVQVEFTRIGDVSLRFA